MVIFERIERAAQNPANTAGFCVWNSIHLLYSTDTDDGTVGQRFTYDQVPDGGAEATLYCDGDVQILLLSRDRSELTVEYEVTTTVPPGNSGKAARGTLTL